MLHHAELSFVDSLLKKSGWQNAVLLWCILQAGPPYLHYYSVVVLHSCIVLPPVGHSSNNEYHCCQLKRQSSYVSHFYRTFKIFLWLSLVANSSVTLSSVSTTTKYCHLCRVHQRGTSFCATENTENYGNSFFFYFLQFWHFLHFPYDGDSRKQ